MNEKKLKEPPDTKLVEPEEEKQQALFPDIFDVSDLKIDKCLPILKFNKLSDIVETSHDKINVSVNVPAFVKDADLFLFVNDIKLDMFYKVSAGEYKFKNIKLLKDENIVELFYRIGGRRSISVYSLIKRK